MASLDAPTNANASLKLFRGTAPAPNYTWVQFVNKLEAILRFNHVRYSLESGSPFEAPRGKIPYIQLPGVSSKIGDSHLITQHLVTNGLMKDPSGSLTAVQKAQEVAMQSMIEDKLYFLGIHECWMKPRNFYQMRDVGPLSVVPYLIRVPLSQLIYTRVRFTLYNQGTSRFTDEELTGILAECLDATSGLLSSNRPSDSTGPYWILGTSNATELDGSLYGFLTATLVCGGSGVVKAAIRRYPVLMDYATRIHEEYFHDYKKWVETEY